MTVSASNPHEKAWRKELLQGQPTESSVQHLIEQRGVYNAPSPFQLKFGAIEYAVKAQVSESILRLLIDAKAAPVEFPRDNEYHVLNRALSDGRPESVVDLLFQTAVKPTQPTVSKVGNYVRGTLDFAIEKRYSWPVVQELLKRGAKASSEAIQLARTNGYFDQEGIPENAEQILRGDRPTKSDLSPTLKTALITGKTSEEIQALLDQGVKPEQPDVFSRNRGDLERAVCSQKCTDQVVQLLVEHGARPVLSRENEPGTLANALVQKRGEAIIHSLIGARASLGSRAYLDVARQNGYSQPTLDLLEGVAPPQEIPQGESELLSSENSPRFCACLDGILPAFLVNILEGVCGFFSAIFGGIIDCFRELDREE